MIASIRLINWEGHRNSYIVFSEKTNGIIGSSDCGKSSIMKAMSWVLTNRPLGDSFRSTWGGDTIIEVVTTDGHTVRRVQTNNANKYFVDNLELKAFGTNVPDEVIQCLNMSDLNIAKQFSSFCLLSETAGEVSRKLNKAANLDKIDHCLSSVASEIKETKQRLKATEVQVGELYTKLQEFTGLQERGKQIELLEVLIQQCEQDSVDIKYLSDLMGAHKSINESILSINIDSSWVAHIKNIEELSKKNTEDKLFVNKLKTCVQKYNECQNKLATLKDTGEDVAQLVSFVETSAEYQKTQMANMKQLGNLVKKYMLITLGIKRLGIDDLEKEFNSLMPDICPLCGSVTI